ncbi:MAG: hypothetical protein ACT6Q5_14275 [Sphingopyxis solisilvae]|uniref:hypothetical protein n=1 Tax=Sphingopyxis solisilvae TaxID=1886788 RepID=UPI00403588A9
MSSKKGMALLAMLAMSRNGERSRTWLQSRLWGTRAQSQGQSSLRREISTLRSVLEESGFDVLTANAATVRLDLDRVIVDLDRLPGGRRYAAEEFLEGFDIAGEEGFEEWLRETRALVGEQKEPARGIVEGIAPLTLATATSFALPSKPSIAVLPFTDLSSAQEGAHLADGIVEEISIVLSRFSTLFVVSSGSSLIYRDPALDRRQVCRELGVRYLLQGSFQLAAGRVRLSTVLIDGESNRQVWADSFDEALEDLFSLRDRLARIVAVRIDSGIEKEEMRKALSRPVQSPDAYQLYFRANALFRRWDAPSIGEAIGLTEQVLAIEPSNAWASALCGFCHGTSFASGWSADPAAARTAALAHYERAMRFGVDDPVVLGYGIGILIAVGGDMEVADGLVERALNMAPGSASILFWAGWVDVALGRDARALDRFEITIRLNPRSTVRPFAVTGLGMALCGLGRFEDARLVLREAYQHLAHYPPTATAYCATLVETGRIADAKPLAEQIAARGGIQPVLAILQDPKSRDFYAASYAAALGQ